MAAVDQQMAFTRKEAAEVTGYSWDVISAAVRSGDLRETYPEVNGKRLQRGVILREDLHAWLKSGDTS